MFAFIWNTERTMIGTFYNYGTLSIKINPGFEIPLKNSSTCSFTVGDSRGKGSLFFENYITSRQFFVISSLIAIFFLVDLHVQLIGIITASVDFSLIYLYPFSV